jgi:hypothetical protein
MKKTILTLSAFVSLGITACKKSSDSQISLTPSETQVTVGQQVSVALSAAANASNWTITPSATSTKTYGLTTSKINYFSFTQPGVYRISVTARTIAYDSTSQSLQQAWNNSGSPRGGCKNGVDSASVQINVTGK